MVYLSNNSLHSSRLKYPTGPYNVIVLYICVMYRSWMQNVMSNIIIDFPKVQYYVVTLHVCFAFGGLTLLGDVKIYPNDNIMDESYYKIVYVCDCDIIRNVVTQVVSKLQRQIHDVHIFSAKALFVMYTVIMKQGNTWFTHFYHVYVQ